MSSNDNLVKQKTFNRRIIFIAAINIWLFLVLICRLGFMQIYQYRRYRRLADNNRYRAQIIVGKRGEILDHKGQKIATNQLRYRLLLNPAIAGNVDSLLGKLVNLITIGTYTKEEYILLIKKKIVAHRHRNYFIHLISSKKELFRVESNLIHLPGIFVDGELTRYYPFGQSTGHFTGYVGKPTNSNVNYDASLKKLYANADIKVGMTGIEKMQEINLRGNLGISLTEVDAAGNVIGSFTHTNTSHGEAIYTNIDLDLQNFTTSLLGNASGCVTVLNARNGNILAMQSIPCFDPNQLLYGMSSKSWGQIAEQNPGIFINKNLAMLYPPGSTFKIISALTALETSNLDPYRTFRCTGEYRLGNRTFHCHKEHGHGKVDLFDAIAQSCNCYFYNIASTIDIDHVARYAQILGLGKTATLGISTEHAGTVPSREWKKANFRARWTMGDSFNMIIGQGYLTTTPMQLAIMIARIASGKTITPSILVHNNEQTLIEKLDVNQEKLEIVQQAIQGTFTRPNGNCRYYHTRDPRYMMAGKTGTAQVISRRIKNNKDEQKRFISHSLFVGYAPVHDPKLAISVVMEHGSGSTSASLLAKRITQYALKNLDI